MTCPVCSHQASSLLRKSPGVSFLCCESCGAQYLDPIESELEPEVLFENWDWTREFNTHYLEYLPLIQDSLGERLRVIKSLTGRQPRSILDVGCGNGIYLEAAEYFGFQHIVGTEVDPHNAAIAAKRGFDVLFGKLEQLDIKQRFDFVHMRQMLHLCPRPAEVLACASSLLAPHGVLFVDTVHRDGLFALARELFQHDPIKYGQLRAPTVCVSYSRRAFYTLLERSSLTPQRTFTYSAGHPFYSPCPFYRIEFGIKSLLDPFGRGAFLAAYCTHKNTT